MFKHHIKIARRNLLRKRNFPVINIGGLAVAMSVVLIIGLYCWDELSFDKDNPNYNRIALVMQHTVNNGETVTLDNTPFPLAATLRQDYRNDFQYIALSLTIDHILNYDGKAISKRGSFFEPQAPRLLNLKMLSGTRDGLMEPNSILITRSLAHTCFGSADPLNRVIKIDNKEAVKVTGVYEDLPANSSFADMNYILPMQLLQIRFGSRTLDTLWQGNYFKIYVQLADNAQMELVSNKLRDVLLNRQPNAETAHYPQLFLQPMSRWHLYSDFKDGRNAGGRIQYVWLFGMIGIFVLILACINFTNLATARSERRAKQVGILKTIGSSRWQLIAQFYMESMIVSILAFILSLGLAQIMLPFFNQVADKKLVLYWTSPLFWLLGLGFSIFCGILAGSYPALYLSSFQPVRVLKGVFKAGSGAAWPRKILVVFQFAVSVLLMVGTVVVFKQVEFAKGRPGGYNRDRLVELRVFSPGIHDHLQIVTKELIDKGSIANMAESIAPVAIPATSLSFDQSFDWRGKAPGAAIAFPLVDVSADYGKTVRWEFKTGRDFSGEFATDSGAFVINEAAKKYMGFSDPLGQKVKLNNKEYTVIGVIKDMIMGSPYEPVRPTLYRLSSHSRLYSIMRLNPSRNTHDAIQDIEAVFRKYNPSDPFDLQFVEDEYTRKFNDEVRIGRLAGFFSLLAILISCLGLFGIASFTVEQREKEIGIRKILGASVLSLWKLLSVEFVILVSIALLIAIPISYAYMSGWLQKFPYRTGISAWIFLGAAVGAFAITIGTVSYQALKAARTNPSTSLRTD